MDSSKNKYRYPGTRPFSIAEKELFFGRDQDINGLIQLIKLDKQVVLYGKSGNLGAIWGDSGGNLGERH